MVCGYVSASGCASKNSDRVNVCVRASSEASRKGCAVAGSAYAADGVDGFSLVLVECSPPFSHVQLPSSLQ